MPPSRSESFQPVGSQHPFNSPTITIRLEEEQCKAGRYKTHPSADSDFTEETGELVYCQTFKRQ
ncbi:hypothetical protein H920_15556 [Fukomys damarensis]|uniref:Uncharacterized protein n=1 Tax=Fukomys damarensis TaxID=885580 RepID=A0A091DJS3_FUKDA|nr:hypothetical protein H920_15556 [Fukomys damarensis]